MPKDDKPRALLLKEEITEPDKRLLITRLERRDAPAIGIFDEPTRCYRINLEWAAHIAGAISTLTEIQAWIGATDEQHFAIQSILQFLRGTACDMINCSDIEDCLQTSQIIDQITAVTYATQEAATQASLDALILLYDGTPQSIGSFIPGTAANQNSMHDNALCRTLELYVSIHAIMKEIRLKRLSDFGEAYLNLMASMRELFGRPVAWLLLLLGDMIGGCAPDVANAITALADKNAQLELACCLHDELRSGSISEPFWNAALAACAASLTGNAGIIACLLDFDNDISHALRFFEAYSGILERQVAGESFSCHCLPPEYFWIDSSFEWLIGEHSGAVQSPLLRVVNPANGLLVGLVTHDNNLGPGFGGFRVIPSGEPDQLVNGGESARGSALWFHCNIFVGTCEGADAVDWPAGQRNDIDWNAPVLEPNQTWSVQFSHIADLGHTASGFVKSVRFLYREVP